MVDIYGGTRLRKGDLAGHLPAKPHKIPLLLSASLEADQAWASERVGTIEVNVNPGLNFAPSPIRVDARQCAT